MEWISVKDRLPESKYHGMNILTVNKRHGVSTDYSYYDNKWWWIDSKDNCFTDDDVTHWMPLPELPEESK